MNDTRLVAPGMACRPWVGLSPLGWVGLSPVGWVGLSTVGWGCGGVGGGEVLGLKESLTAFDLGIQTTTALTDCGIGERRAD